ncbi:MAG: type II toxin-antitoxin system prevent-host-death family antitoxin [Planctomycetota bacterium]
MITVSKSLLKAKMLEYFRRVEETGEELIVTSHGTPTLKVVPIRSKVTPEAAFGVIRERAEAHGDPVEPETEEWGEV